MTSSMTYKSVLEAEAKWFSHFKEALAEKHRNYNEEIGMFRRPFSSPGYHTTIKEADFVHSTKESLDYALAVLDSGEERYRERALAILRNMVSLQDGDPASPTFGIWSWFWEEPLEKMSPPDWNWADFIGKRLLLILIRHGDGLSDELAQSTRQAVRNSCEAIIRRNVGPDYTNIAIMGAFVTIIAGEVLEERAYAEYGLARLKRLYDYSMQTGAFLEYNSPVYSTVAIQELSALATYTRSEEVKRLTNELLDTTWQMIAEHFHPSLKQWSGPHARSYHTFLAPEHLSFLHMACGGEVPIVSEEEFTYDPEWYGQGVACPSRLFGLFTSIGERELQQELPPYPEFRTRTSYTYMTADYSIGSFNHNVMWNQCRNLLAYVRTGEGERGYVRLRVLHDGYDFCSAVFKGGQKKAAVLYGIQFALDGGDTHVNLDPIHGRMKASDLRIRIEIGCSGSAPEWKRLDEDSFQAVLGRKTLSVQGLYGAMDGFGPFRWETASDGSDAWLDFVLYEGEAKEIDFHALEEALFVFALSLSEQGAKLPEASLGLQEHAVQAKLTTPEEPLQLTLVRKPANRAVLLHD
ncbi:hypothetical protein [Paenibacillus contaminans]|uniref:Heparinase n=1 Tax=Paenibacillus contaminans TaxID=450362 RepID=A0A329M8N2_9BACL|nr:hypothetical protein [Paenibacillus contaminans]RAV16108.1 hypothetical protein DQG23_29395 [Paenibacillus contaminans]